MPLCPELYARLKRLFGKVVIANEGQSARVTQLQVLGRMQTQVSDGEYLRVNCPFCEDTKGRLWVNYQYPQFPWLAVCYNDTACMTGAMGAIHRPRLRRMIFSEGGRETMPIHYGRAEETEVDPNTLPLAEYPGSGLYVNQLPVDHHVREYLTSRQFDVDELSREYSVGMLTSSETYPWLIGNICFPAMMYGRMVGWQTRYPADVDFKQTGIRKYFNLPDMPKRAMLYGFDQAKAWSFVIVVEGATDVWRIGAPAVCLYGSSLSPTQRRLLIDNWSTIFVYLDGDTIPLKPNQTVSTRDNLMADLLSLATPAHTIIPVDLPIELDPGKLSRQENRARIRSAATARGIPIDLSW